MGLGNVLAEIHEGRNKRHILTFLKDNLPVEEVVPFRGDDWYIRASRIPRLCPREEVLVWRNQFPSLVKRTADNAWWFGLGTAFHYVFQTVLLGPQGVLHGLWRCQCGWGTEERGPMPAECPKCGRKGRFLFVEEEVSSPDGRLVGHMDGILMLEGMPPAVIDFKTVQPYEFHKCSEVPNPDHVMQLQVYMMLAGLDNGVLLYINKHEGKMDAALAEHWIRRNEKQTEAIQRLVAKVKEGIEGGVLPGGVCCTRDERRAKQCGLRDLCFRTGDGP